MDKKKTALETLAEQLFDRIFCPPGISCKIDKINKEQCVRCISGWAKRKRSQRMDNKKKQVTALDVVIDHISRIKKYLSDEPCNYCPLCIDNEENKYRPECGLSETPPPD